MRSNSLTKILVGLSACGVVVALVLSATSGPQLASAAPPAQPSERPTIDINATHAAETAAAQPTDTPVTPATPITPATPVPNTPVPTTDGGGGGGGGGGSAPSATPIIFASPTLSPSPARPRSTRTPSPTPTFTPDIPATNQALVLTAVNATLTALPPGSNTTFVTVTVMASVMAPTVVVTVIPTLAPTVPVTAAPITPTVPQEDARLGWWLLGIFGLVVAFIAFFWWIGYRFILPFFALGKARPRQGMVRESRQYARRKRGPS